MDIRALPTPVSILEVMGRDAGWLTAATLLGRKDPDDAPHLIYVPERPLGRESFLRDVQKVYDRQGWVVIAVSEGAKDETGESWAVSRTQQTVDGFGHRLPGDVATRLASLVTLELGLRARSEKPGLLGRSCSMMASSVDRREAREVGRFGFSWAIKGNTGFMVSIQREDSTAYSVEYAAVPLKTVANLTRLLPPQYVSGDGNDIKEEYRAYVKPLIGDPLRRYARLDSSQLPPTTC
jgi:6-phosphofructokinase 1